MFSEYQPVALVRDISAAERAGFEDLDFKCGDVGVLVDFLGGKGGAAIEFNLGKAHTADVLFISESDIRSIQSYEVWHTRLLNPHQRDTEPAEWERGLFDLMCENSVVVLTRDFQDTDLKKGDLGVVKSCNDETGTYQVQMAVGQEWEGPLLTLRCEDIRLRERDELATVRELAPTSPALGCGQRQS